MGGDDEERSPTSCGSPDRCRRRSGPYAADERTPDSGWDAGDFTGILWALRKSGQSLLCHLARVRLCASGNNSQYLAADRAAAGADEEPVGREGPPRSQVRGENAGLGA